MTRQVNRSHPFQSRPGETRPPWSPEEVGSVWKTKGGGVERIPLRETSVTGSDRGGWGL